MVTSLQDILLDATLEQLEFTNSSELRLLARKGLMGRVSQTSIKELLEADLYRYCGDTGLRSFLNSYFRDPGFRFTYHLRNVAYYFNKRKSLSIFLYLYHRLQLNRLSFKFGFDISPSTSIGEGLYIGHFGGVVISCYAVLGSNVNIAHGVTIGHASRGVRTGAPILEDRVWVGTGAIIVGKVTIGHDSLIGPGAYVNFDVPAMSLVLGNPGKIVSHRGSIGYVNKVLHPLVDTLISAPIEDKEHAMAY